jgi:hypothetical protein
MVKFSIPHNDVHPDVPGGYALMFEDGEKSKGIGAARLMVFPFTLTTRFIWRNTRIWLRL